MAASCCRVSEDPEPLRHLVIEIVPITALATCHRLHQPICLCCSTSTCASFPADVEVSGYGSLLIALVGLRARALPFLPLEPACTSDLISFLKALPDYRMLRGIRFPQCWMLLVAILAILSKEGFLVDMERFALCHHQTLNELLGTDFAKEPSGSTF